jgi:hypothetical protein
MRQILIVAGGYLVDWAVEVASQSIRQAGCRLYVSGRLTVMRLGLYLLLVESLNSIEWKEFYAPVESRRCAG